MGLILVFFLSSFNRGGHTQAVYMNLEHACRAQESRRAAEAPKRYLKCAVIQFARLAWHTDSRTVSVMSPRATLRWRRNRARPLTGGTAENAKTDYRNGLCQVGPSPEGSAPGKPEKRRRRPKSATGLDKLGGSDPLFPMNNFLSRPAMSTRDLHTANAVGPNADWPKTANALATSISTLPCWPRRSNEWSGRVWSKRCGSPPATALAAMITPGRTPPCPHRRLPTAGAAADVPTAASTSRSVVNRQGCRSRRGPSCCGRAWPRPKRKHNPPRKLPEQGRSRQLPRQRLPISLSDMVVAARGHRVGVIGRLPGLRLDLNYLSELVRRARS